MKNFKLCDKCGNVIASYNRFCNVCGHDKFKEIKKEVEDESKKKIFCDS